MSELDNFSDEKLQEELNNRAEARKKKALEEGRARADALRTALTRMPELIDFFAPTHSRTSCNDSSLVNGYAPEGTTALRCTRCYLLDIRNYGVGSDAIDIFLEIRAIKA